MRGLLQFIMYAGAAGSIVAFLLPRLDYKIGPIEVPMHVASYLPWVCLAMVLVGYFGRRLTDRDDGY